MIPRGEESPASRGQSKGAAAKSFWKYLMPGLELAGNQM
jgi:hypothetical protein